MFHCSVRSGRLILLLFFSVLLLLAPSRQVSASSIDPLQTEEIPVCQAEAVTIGDASAGCKDLQVILLIDSSASMVGNSGNDPEGLRFFGATEAANIMAQKYLEAVEAGVRDLPELNIAAIHFGSTAPSRYFSGWIPIAPQDREAWENEGRAAVSSALVPDGVETFIPQVFPATNFILPFQAAAELAETIGGPGESGCPNRIVLVLTDGAPATSFTFTGSRLQSHMAEVRDIVSETFSGPGDEVYVTAISTGEDYWTESRPLWEDITNNSQSRDVERTARVPDAASLATRMANIIATKVGLEIETREVGTVFIPPFLESVRISYFAPAAAAELIVTGPGGLAVEPDGETVILTGTDTAAKVLEIKNPTAGPYNLSTTIEGGEIAIIFDYADVTISFENRTANLQQHTLGDVQVQILDSAGSPVSFSGEFAPRYEGTLSVPGNPVAVIPQQTSESSVLSFEATPAAAGTGSVKLRAIGINRHQQDCLLSEGEVTFEVDAVGITAQPASGTVCTPSGMPLRVPLRLTNLRTGEPATLGRPVIWTIDSQHSAGGAVDAAVLETGEPGAYELTISSQMAGTIRTDVTASAGSKDTQYLLYTESFNFNTLFQDRAYAFELTGVDEPADERTIRINRWLGRIPDATDSLLVLGSRRSGGPDSSRVSITGRYFDTQTGFEVPGIERFLVSVLDAEDQVVFGPTNDWYEGDDGRQTLSFSAPPLGSYTVHVADLGAPEACLAVMPPVGAGFILVGLQWGTTVLLVTVAVLVLITAITAVRWFICTRAGPLTVKLKEEHDLRVAPHEEDSIDLATLTRLLRLVVQEKARPAAGKLEDREGWLHVYVQVDGYVRKPDICSDRGRPMIDVPEKGKVPVHEGPDRGSDLLLHVNRCAYVEVLEELEKWYRVRVTLSGYIDASFAVQAEGRFRTCFRKELIVRLAHAGELQAAPLDTKSQDLIRLHRPVELTVLEDETNALAKLTENTGWLSVQTRLEGYVPAGSIAGDVATVVQARPDRPVQVFEFAGEDGYLLADVLETAPARIIEREGEWCRVEVQATGYVRSNEASRPSKPFGSDRPDRPPITQSKIDVPECKDRSKPDDLKIIEGIGPQVEKLLNAHGIWTFEDLAAYEGRTDTIEAWLDERKWEMMTPATWPQQAALAAAENWAGLNALIARLTAGRPLKKG